MGTFKESDYYMSNEHLKNLKLASVKGILKIQELRDQRIKEYYKNPKLCKECGEPISYEKKNEREFCNSSCSAKFNNKRRNVTDEQKLKTSLTLLKGGIKKIRNKEIIIVKDVVRVCLNCSKEFIIEKDGNKKLSRRKYCCKECSNIGMREKISKMMKERVENGSHKGWLTRNIISYPEKFFINVLDNNNLKYEHNKVIKQKDLGINNMSNYFLDFYFDDKRIDLEIDGNQHKYRKEHDNLRDELLENNGIHVYRIKWLNPINEINKDYLKIEINKFLKFYGGVST